MPSSIRSLSRPTNRVVRLGDSRSLPVHLEVPLTLAIPDSLGHIHAHNLYYSVLDVLSHDAIIGLVDLIGPYYDLFEDSISSSRKLADSSSLINHIDDISTAVNAITASVPTSASFDPQTLALQKQEYHNRKMSICASSFTTVDSLALQDGSSVQVLFHPTQGTVYADNSIEHRYDLLTSILVTPIAGQTIPPWSRPIDTIAPEESATPDPTSFPDDILTYLTTTHDEAKESYLADLDTHVTPEMKTALSDDR